MNKERLEAYKKICNQIKQISKQKEVQQQKNLNQNKENKNEKRLTLTKKDGFINMSLILEFILGISLAVGTMSIINTILTNFIK